MGFSPEDYPPGHPARVQMERALAKPVRATAAIAGQRRPMRRPEQDLQIACIELADYWTLPLSRADYPAWPAWLRTSKAGDWLLHVPNGGGRSVVEGAIFKAMGVRAGVHDLLFMLPVRWVEQRRTSAGAVRLETFAAGLWLELKAGTGELTDSQARFGAKARAVGYRTAEVRTVPEFQDAIRRYLWASIPLQPSVAADSNAGTRWDSGPLSPGLEPGPAGDDDGDTRD